MANTDHDKIIFSGHKKKDKYHDLGRTQRKKNQVAADLPSNSYARRKWNNICESLKGKC